jgi:hypothetical protein
MKKGFSITLILVLAIAITPVISQDGIDDPFAAPPINVVADEPTVTLDDGGKIIFPANVNDFSSLVHQASADSPVPVSPDTLQAGIPSQNENPSGDVSIPPVNDQSVEKTEITSGNNISLTIKG